MIGGDEQPEIVRTRLKSLLQPAETMLHSFAHPRRLFAQLQDVRSGTFRQSGQLSTMRSNHDEDVLHFGLLKRCEDQFENRAFTQRQGEFGPAHARALAGGGQQGESHERAVSTDTRLRGRGSVVPRLRQEISSATMLMAISGTVCEPMTKPSGA